MLKKSLILAILVAFSLIFVDLFISYEGNDELSMLGKYYAEEGVTDVGAQNLVTAIVVTYRGLDTLGEVVILFLTAAIIGFFLKLTKEESKNNKREERVKPTSEILQTGAKALAPLIFLFGIYIFINGHLTPGGGFQGGAVIATGFVLLVVANPVKKINHGVIAFVESISGFSFVLIGVLGILLAGGFLDNSILKMGTFGQIFSAGVIPIIYSFIGLKVGAELSGIVGSFNECQADLDKK
ncbi:MAG: Na(+)/H(+) antiporter subunit B [Bacteroidota bacterium]|nr:Na(+)/H(+) antiporter subunit B [Bacteroidota bacterium]